MVKKFNFAATPKIIFGSGNVKLLPQVIESYGSSVLLITGNASFIRSDHWDKLLLQFESARITWKHFAIVREPTPSMVDECVDKYRGQAIDSVVAIGGGSVIDAGKAISAMLVEDGSVRDYLEGIGHRHSSGRKIPYLALPTTSGTGAETTKNAVISEVGDLGFKKSIRHDNYTPNVALIDPELTLGCPKIVSAQSGMDAFTQLLESYLSTNANPITDALAVDGIRYIRDALGRAVQYGEDLSAREMMAYASMISGITLANAGLGTVHGFASSIGGFFDIPHGLVCARMMAPVNRLTVEKLRLKAPESQGLYKYARIGKLFSENKGKSNEFYIDLLLDVIEQWAEEFEFARLSKFGISEVDFSRIVSKTGNKFNPIELDKEELEGALEMAI